jgi:hypothetical protein
LLWQSKHALTASARVAGESHFGSLITGGFVRRTGANWMAINTASKIAAMPSSVILITRRIDRPGP